jgi:daunosaminyl-N,N-dimethyltransferase/N-dimethyltransferase
MNADDGMYGHRARYYDPIYHWKDYAAEAARLRALLAAEGVAPGAQLLEAACGTGTTLALLRADYRVAGFDLADAMLAVAREKVPDVALFRADMTDFAVDAPVDALLCLFSSIGYVHPEARLRAAAACFARAVRPGGALIVEPWLAPDGYTPGRASMQTYDGAGLKLCRACISQREGEMAVLRFHWLAAAQGAPEVEHFVETHHLWLCPTATLLAAFEDAGFACRMEPDGLSPGRGLLIGRRREG